MLNNWSYSNHAGSQGPLDLQAQIVRAERNELGKMGGLQLQEGGPRSQRPKLVSYGPQSIK